MRRVLHLSAVLLLLPVSAPAADMDKYSDLIRKCASGRCENAVNSVLAQMDQQDLNADEKTEELGLLALAVYDAARAAEDDDTRQRSSRSLRMLASATEDSLQKEAFTSVADAIEAGDTSLYDLDDPFSVSPY